MISDAIVEGISAAQCAKTATKRESTRMPTALNWKAMQHVAHLVGSQCSRMNRGHTIILLIYKDG